MVPSPPDETRVWIADEKPLARVGLRAVLEQSGVRVTGEVGSVMTLLESLRSRLPPDVLVLGLRRWMEGLSLIAAERPDLPVVVLSGQRERVAARVALQAGAAGFVARRSAVRRLPGALRRVVETGRYVSPELADDFALAMVEGRDPAETDPTALLSAREVQVVCLYAQGLSRAEIARHISVAPTSVAEYRRRALDKLGLHTTVDLVLFAFEHGLAVPGPPLTTAPPPAAP